MCGWPRPASCLAAPFTPDSVAAGGAGELAKSNLAGKIGGAAIKCEQVCPPGLGCCCRRLMPALRGPDHHFQPIPTRIKQRSVGASHTSSVSLLACPAPLPPPQKDKDRYGRVVAVCRMGATFSLDLNRHMVESGLALAYRQVAPAAGVTACCFRELLPIAGHSAGCWRQSWLPCSCTTRCLPGKLTHQAHRPTAAGSTAATMCQLSRRHAPASAACGRAPSSRPGSTAMAPPRLPHHQRLVAHHPAASRRPQAPLPGPLRPRPLAAPGAGSKATSRAAGPGSTTPPPAPGTPRPTLTRAAASAGSAARRRRWRRAGGRPGADHTNPSRLLQAVNTRLLPPFSARWLGVRAPLCVASQCVAMTACSL